MRLHLHSYISLLPDWVLWASMGPSPIQHAHIMWPLTPHTKAGHIFKSPDIIYCFFNMDNKSKTLVNIAHSCCAVNILSSYFCLQAKKSLVLLFVITAFSSYFLQINHQPSASFSQQHLMHANKQWMVIWHMLQCRHLNLKWSLFGWRWFLFKKWGCFSVDTAWVSQVQFRLQCFQYSS